MSDLKSLRNIAADYKIARKILVIVAGQCVGKMLQLKKQQTPHHLIKHHYGRFLYVLWLHCVFDKLSICKYILIKTAFLWKKGNTEHYSVTSGRTLYHFFIHREPNNSNTSSLDFIIGSVNSLCDVTHWISFKQWKPFSNISCFYSSNLTLQEPMA